MDRQVINERFDFVSTMRAPKALATTRVAQNYRANKLCQNSLRLVLSVPTLCPAQPGW